MWRAAAIALASTLDAWQAGADRGRLAVLAGVTFVAALAFPLHLVDRAGGGAGAPGPGDGRTR